MAYTTSSHILGTGTVSAEAINAYFRYKGPQYAPQFAPDKTYKAPPPTIGQDIIAVCRQWGINWDGMAAQILHESAAWQSRIVRDKNNPSGLGAVDNDAYRGAVTFSTPFEGIRATAAHLMTYAAGDGEWTSYDPRASAVPAKNKGAAKTWGSLGGKWATDSGYGSRIVSHMNAMVSFANDGAWDEEPMSAQIPGFKWIPADSEHFTRGRGGKRIVGGAQHYSAGTNSLGWLTTTSGRNPYDPDAMVSAHFLIHRNPTMEDRGYQLVRIEDTAYTTGGAVNPITVAIEKEHLVNQTLDDMDYAVMAQTWADIERYVLDHNLGDFSQGIKGHKVWVNQPDRVCPDGIDVDRIVREWQPLRGGNQPQPPAGEWPKVPVTERDPWRADNPYGKSRWIPRVFVEDIRKHDWHLTGFCVSEAFGHNDQVVQYFERARLELNRDGSVTRGLVGIEAMECRYPERRKR